jgi:hypothetical protein
VQVIEEFSSMHPTSDVQLRDVWPRDAILRRATEEAVRNGDLRDIIGTVSDDAEEGSVPSAAFLNFLVMMQLTLTLM